MNQIWPQSEIKSQNTCRNYQKKTSFNALPPQGMALCENERSGTCVSFFFTTEREIELLGASGGTRG